MKLIANPFAWAAGLVLAPVAAADVLELESTVISASPLASRQSQLATPAEVLEGDDLVKTREPTLGETLEKLPGVRSSSFGAGVGRPVIRGQSGARVKILSDGVDVLDASSISPDHTVTSEPLLAERIEVLKGPATLMYGGGAIGGVVNVIDRKVPVRVPEKGYEGELELRTNTVANEAAGVFGLTAGAGHFALRAEGMKRQDNDYAIPGPGKEQGSYNNNHTYALGGSFIGEQGYIGAAYSREQNRYGLLGHEHAECSQSLSGWQCAPEHEADGDSGTEDEHEAVPYIDLDQRRWDLRAELEDPLPLLERARLRMAHSRYQHQEIEDGAVSTQYNSRATDGRLELTHQPLLGWRGTLGGQFLRRNFRSSGEEAYVPQTITHNRAIFLVEEYVSGNWRYELGLRREWQHISAVGQPDRQHRGLSFSAGMVWNFLPDYALGLSWTRSQRLPTPEELYSDGPHAATSTVELGDPDLKKETAHNAELSLRKLAGWLTFSASLYRNTISNYIYGAYTGQTLGSGYRELHYRQDNAVFTGGEGELRLALTEATAVTFFGDLVRGRLRHNQGWLPRIPSDRLGLRLDQRLLEGLDGQLEFYRTRHQNKVAAYETRTAGYSMLNASLSYDGLAGPGHYLLYLKVNNLLNERWRNVTSYIKDKVVMPGRNLSLGLRVTF